jgi:hypothetical protein
MADFQIEGRKKYEKKANNNRASYGGHDACSFHAYRLRPQTSDSGGCTELHESRFGSDVHR